MLLLVGKSFSGGGSGFCFCVLFFRLLGELATFLIIAKRIGDNLSHGLAVCGASNGFGSCEVHGESGVEDESSVFKLEYLSHEVRARGGGWKGRVDVEGGWDWAGSVLATTGLLEGGGLEESHDFCLLCVHLHAISNTPFLADI